MPHAIHLDRFHIKERLHNTRLPHAPQSMVRRANSPLNLFLFRSLSVILPIVSCGLLMAQWKWRSMDRELVLPRRLTTTVIGIWAVLSIVFSFTRFFVHRHIVKSSLALSTGPVARSVWLSSGIEFTWACTALVLSTAAMISLVAQFAYASQTNHGICGAMNSFNFTTRLMEVRRNPMDLKCILYIVDLPVAGLWALFMAWAVLKLFRTARTMTRRDQATAWNITTEDLVSDGVKAPAAHESNSRRASAYLNSVASRRQSMAVGFQPRTALMEVAEDEKEGMDFQPNSYSAPNSLTNTRPQSEAALDSVPALLNTGSNPGSRRSSRRASTAFAEAGSDPNVRKNRRASVAIGTGIGGGEQADLFKTPAFAPFVKAVAEKQSQQTGVHSHRTSINAQSAAAAAYTDMDESVLDDLLSGGMNRKSLSKAMRRMSMPVQPQGFNPRSKRLSMNPNSLVEEEDSPPADSNRGLSAFEGIGQTSRPTAHEQPSYNDLTTVAEAQSPEFSSHRASVIEAQYELQKQGYIIDPQYSAEADIDPLALWDSQEKASEAMRHQEPDHSRSYSIDNRPSQDASGVSESELSPRSSDVPLQYHALQPDFQTTQDNWRAGAFDARRQPPPPPPIAAYSMAPGLDSVENVSRRQKEAARRVEQAQDRSTSIAAQTMPSNDQEHAALLDAALQMAFASSDGSSGPGRKKWGEKSRKAQQGQNRPMLDDLLAGAPQYEPAAARARATKSEGKDSGTDATPPIAVEPTPERGIDFNDPFKARAQPFDPSTNPSTARRSNRSSVIGGHPGSNYI